MSPLLIIIIIAATLYIRREIITPDEKICEESERKKKNWNKLSHEKPFNPKDIFYIADILSDLAELQVDFSICMESC